MYDRVLYDRIINEKAIPNGLENPKIIDMFQKGEWTRYSIVNDVPDFPPDKISLTHECDSGVYPICIREPSALNPYTINALLLSAGDRTLSLMRSGDIKLCWFIENEPPRDVAEIFKIETSMRDWNIDNYAIFCNLPLQTISKFSDRTFPSVFHELYVFAMVKTSTDVVKLPKRFNCLINTDNIYDWRLFCLDLLNRAGVIKNSLFSFDQSASMINTESIHREEITTYLKHNEHSIRTELAKHAYWYIHYDDIFAKSAFSIVIEAYLNYDTVVNYTFISEKTMRPIVLGQPFIIYGQSNSLPYLHERGYRTFHPHIDESYDSIDDDFLRLKTVTAEIVRINSLTDEEFETLMIDLAPIVEHNAAQAQENIKTYYARIFESNSC